MKKLKKQHRVNLRKFVSLEGIDFTGKTTLSKWLVRDLRKQEMEVVITRDPPYYISPWGQFQNFLESGTNIAYLSEAFLLLTARIDNYERIILPALLNGSVVIADRFTDSWLAYQSVRLTHYFRDELEALSFLTAIQNKLIIHGFLGLPGLTLWIYENPEIAIKRALTARKISKYENLAIQQQVDKQYQILHKRYPERIKLVDARGIDIHETYSKVLRIVTCYFNKINKKCASLH